MPSIPKKPRPRQVGSYRLRAIRGPREDGRWYWRAERYAEGASQTAWTGWGTVTEADTAVAALLTTGERHSTEPDEVETVKDLLSFWHGQIEESATLSPATISGYGNRAAALARGIGTVRVERLDRLAIERYRDSQIRAGRTPRGVAADLCILRLSWRWGREMGLVPDRELPTVSVRLPELVRARAEPEDIARVLESLEGAVALHLLLLWGTGCRVSEIGALRWRDCTKQDSTTWITVTGKGRTRRIPLPATVAEQLWAWMPAGGRPDAYVLGLTPGASKKALWVALDRAGVDWSAHAVRRAAVDRLYRAGVDVGTASALLGHTPEVALRHYRRAADEDLQDAIRLAALGTLPQGGQVIDLRAAQVDRTNRK